MRSKILGPLIDSNPYYLGYKFTFGYDASTRTYKVVAVLVKREYGASGKTKVEVFNLRDGCWRNIQSFPVVPLHQLDYRYKHVNNGVHLSGTVNWLTMDKSIVSLDLSTETYKQFLLPPGLDDVPFFQPILRVLVDSLCFSHDSKKTEFVLWQMKEYGVQESWTQLFKISYENLQMDLPINPLVCLYINGDTVIFAYKFRTKFRNQAFIYNLKDNTVEKIKCKNCIQWFEEAKDYVESLVSVPWEE
jgi:F-box interacting protein